MFGLPYSLAQLTPPYAPSCNSVLSAVQTHIIYLPTDDEFLLFTRSKNIEVNTEPGVLRRPSKESSPIS